MKTLDIIRAFNPRLGDLGQLVMAGGAVRDELMGRSPKDFDLFLLYPPPFEFKKIKDEIEPRLEDLARKKPVVEWHKSEPYLVATLDYQGSEVQILANPAQTPEALVETFDWSVCLFARTESLIVQLTALDEIAPGKDLKLNCVTFPLSTLRRGFRFSERFKMKFRLEDVTNLCRKIVANADANNQVSPNGNEPDMPSLAANLLPA